MSGNIQRIYRNNYFYRAIILSSDVLLSEHRLEVRHLRGTVYIAWPFLDLYESQSEIGLVIICEQSLSVDLCCVNIGTLLCALVA